MKILLKIAYIGTAYCGYQVQPNGISIQQKLNEAAKALFGFPCDIVGCSRTDSGVHANTYFATYDLPEDIHQIPVNKLPGALNSNLDDDISVIDAKLVPDDFHVRHDVLQKEYVYVINTEKIRNPFDKNRVYYCPMDFDDEKLKLMNNAANTITGKHDFKAFMSTGSDITDTVRNVKYVKAEKDGSYVRIYACADGFLYNMVRIIAGTLLDAARGKLTCDDIRKALETGERSLLGQTLPPYGLYLNNVEFYPA